MKTLLFILSINFIFGEFIIAQVPPNDKNWEEEFVDNFYSLDINRWKVQNNFDHYGEPQMYTNRRDNVYTLSSGKLVIKVLKENYDPLHNYTSGWINTIKNIDMDFSGFVVKCL